MKRAYKVTLAVAALLAAVAIGELHTSYIQSRFFSQLADELSCELQADESRTIIFPDDGPYNIRLGYARLPDFSTRLRQRGYHITHQARFSPALE